MWYFTRRNLVYASPEFLQKLFCWLLIRYLARVIFIFSIQFILSGCVANFIAMKSLKIKVIFPFFKGNIAYIVIITE